MTDEKGKGPDGEELERLYRQSADAEPGSGVDRAVLRRARTAASAPQRRGLQDPGAWGLGLAAAASLVLAVGLYIDHRYRVEIDPPGAVDPDIRLDDRAMRKPEAASPAKQRVSTAPAAAPEEAEAAAGQQAEQAASRTVPAEPTAERKQMNQVRSAEEAFETEEDSGEPAAPPAIESQGLGAREWLMEIQQLIEAGELSRARRELREFRSYYPSNSVPIEIRRRLAASADEGSNR